MALIRFLKPVPPYVAGETAAFEAAAAERLVARGLAEPLAEAGKAPAAPPADKMAGGPRQRRRRRLPRRKGDEA